MTVTKNLFSLILILFAFSTMNAQKNFKKAFSSSGERKVEISVTNAEIIVEGHSGNELLIETDDDWDGPPERAKGLRPLFNDATDNTGLGLEITEFGNTFMIKKAISEDISYSIKVPMNTSIKIDEEGWNGDGFMIKNITGEVEIDSKNSDIQIENIKGSVVANSISGDILVTFAEVNPDKPTYITGTSGFVDVTVPANTKANLRLSSISGDIYTDVDIDFGKKDGVRRIGGGKAYGTMNGGGVEISLKAISDDIYLRKK